MCQVFLGEDTKHSTEIIKNIQMGTVLKIKEGMGKQ